MHINQLSSLVSVFQLSALGDYKRNLLASGRFQSLEALDHVLSVPVFQLLTHLELSLQAIKGNLNTNDTLPEQIDETIRRIGYFQRTRLVVGARISHDVLFGGL